MRSVVQARSTSSIPASTANLPLSSSQPARGRGRGGGARAGPDIGYPRAGRPRRGAAQGRAHVAASARRDGTAACHTAQAPGRAGQQGEQRAHPGSCRRAPCARRQTGLAGRSRSSPRTPPPPCRRPRRARCCGEWGRWVGGWVGGWIHQRAFRFRLPDRPKGGHRPKAQRGADELGAVEQPPPRSGCIASNTLMHPTRLCSAS